MPVSFISLGRCLCPKLGSVGDEPVPASIKLDNPSWSRSSKDLSRVRIWCPEEDITDKAKEFSIEDEGNPSSSPDGKRPVNDAMSAELPSRISIESPSDRTL